MPTWNRRHFVQSLSASAVLSALSSSVWASDAFPSKPLSLVVPYPAGGASDVAARIFAESMGRTLQQQVIVENIGGGTGLLGAGKVLSAPNDAYTFFHGSANEVFLAPMLNPAARYKPQDFSFACPTTEAVIVLMVKNDIPVKTYDEFIEFAKKRQDKPLTYATVGIDSMYNLMGDALAAQLQLPFLHVPYKGAAPALQDVAGGQVDFAILPYQTSFDGMQQQGRLRILTSFSKSLPEPIKHLPLISASRYSPDFEHTIGGGYFVRKGAPAERVAVLRKAISSALATPEIRNKLESEGRNVRQPISTQAQADEVFQQQYQRLQKLIQTVGRKALA